MATQSVRIGWRPYVNLTSAQAAANLLDSYSGAAVAYSLRKLKSSYTGSAIRVRRSSDNTELNIGFDSDGNLDTYSLSAFVGTGNGFVTTWYDQSGNLKNATQVTAANQPSIVLSGAINTQNGKPILITDYNSYMINNSVSINGTTNSIFATIKMVTTRGSIAIMAGYGNDNQHFVSRNINGNGRYYDSGGQEITAALLPNGLNLIGIHENSSGITVYENGANLVTNFAHSVYNTTGIVIFRRDVQDGNYMQSGSGFAELIVYGNSSKLSDNSGISTNINSYYSVYPNPSSVWNLLTAAYNADTTALPSLKTSFFAVYNGESNTNDSKGTNNGTAQGGLTYSTGKIGNAFVFNGSNAYVGLPNNSLNFTSDFSISLWVYLTAFPGEQIPIGNYYESSPSAGNSRGWMIYMTGQNLYWIVCGSSQVNLITSISSFQNTWKQITITFKNGVGSKIYFDGNLVTSNSSTISPIYNSTQTPFIGKYQYGNGSSFGYMSANSKIDAVNIYQKELTASEVSELYNSGNGAQYIGDNFYKPTTNDALLVNNGTAQGGLTYEVGKVGTAFKFNGTNAYVELGDVMDLGLSSWSYGMWFKSTVASAGTLFSKTIAAGLAGRFAAYIDSNRINFLFDPNYSNPLIIGTSNTIVTNTWYHLVCVFDRTSNIRLYLNGVLQSVTTSYGVNDLSQFGAANTNYNTSCPFRIGAYTAGDNINVTSLFNGSIDAFNVWNKVLTQSEITELYNSGNGKQYPN